MADEADLDELARRYLDLWQDQMSALAGDEDFADTMGRIMAAGPLAALPPQSGPAALWAAWPGLMASFLSASVGAGAQQQAGEQPQHGGGAEASAGAGAGAGGATAGHRRSTGRVLAGYWECGSIPSSWAGSQSTRGG